MIGDASLSWHVFVIDRPFYIQKMTETEQLTPYNNKPDHFPTQIIFNPVDKNLLSFQINQILMFASVSQGTDKITLLPVLQSVSRI